MIELLKIEFLKIKHYTVFKAFMIIFAVILPLLMYGVSTITFPGFPAQEVTLGFPGIWGNITYIGGWVNILPGILVVALVFLIALTGVASALMLNTTSDMKMSGASQEKVLAMQEAVGTVDQSILVGQNGNLFQSIVLPENGLAIGVWGKKISDTEILAKGIVPLEKVREMRRKKGQKFRIFSPKNRAPKIHF